MLLLSGVLTLTLSYVGSRWPAIALVLLLAFAVAIFPRLCRLLVAVMLIVGPTFNPPVLGIGAGRLYLLQALLVGVIAASLAYAFRNGLGGSAASIIVVSTLLVIVETVGRPSAGVAWVYRPLQLFLVAFAIRSLFKGRSDRPIILALAWGSAVGCALASVNAVLPSFDPFAISRPTNLPFVSEIGSYARATGAFTYPNNLGTFAAYTVVFGASAWLLDRPRLPLTLSIALMGFGASALILAGSRAAGLGLTCGLLYLTFRAAPRRRTVLLVSEAVFGLLLLSVVLSSPTAGQVLSQRANSATGDSLFGRLDSFHESIDAFLRSPVIGIGSTESNLDNFVILYLTQAGLLGAVLLCVMARTALGRSPQHYPELGIAVLIVLVASGMLQDSLGQTLVTWFPGSLLGVAALATDTRKQNQVPPRIAQTI